MGKSFNKNAKLSRYNVKKKKKLHNGYFVKYSWTIPSMTRLLKPPDQLLPHQLLVRTRTRSERQTC